ncbi:MAG: hypothetical protein ACQKBY_05305, partial [Verrucomicrobiales bacterium]
VEFFEFRGGEELKVKWRKKGGADLWLSERREKKEVSIPIVPSPEEAVIYRNFIEGSSARGIGVGFFELGNYVFSADDLSLDLVWRGKFMDGGRHWVNRGQGFQAPAGEDVTALNRGPAFARLADEKSPWPESWQADLQARFRGYELDDKGRPEFLYEVGGRAVRDCILPAGESAGMKRVVSIEQGSAMEPLVMRLLSGASSLDPADGGDFVVAGKLRLSVKHPGAELRQRGRELLLWLPAGEDLRVEIDYQWIQ